MPMRLTGLMSGLDTETIIQELVAVKRTKVDDAKKAQTKLGWKMEAWKDLNSKIKKLYNNTLSNLRFQGSYVKKTTKVSHSSLVDVITSDSALDSVQSLKIDKMAKIGYLTGGVVAKEDGSKCTTATKLSDIGIEAGSKFEINTNDTTTAIEITDDMTISDLVNKLNAAGVKANFDSATQRFFISASESGSKADFSITANDEQGTDALRKLGILIYDDKSLEKYKYYAGLTPDSKEYKNLVNGEIIRQIDIYRAKMDTLNKTIADQQEKKQNLKADFESAYSDDFDDLVSNKDGALDTLKADIQALCDKGELTEDEQAELDELNKKLSFVEDYQSAQTKIDTAQAELQDIKDNYLTPDEKGNLVVGEQLKADATAWLEDKIAQAKYIIDNKDTLSSEGATKIAGQNAKIYLNGALFESSTNTFEINGLTITVKAESDETVTLTTQNDTTGIYDMIKNFIKEYSSLINEMDKLYNADSAKGYEPLTDDEKDAMNDTEIEKWESKIKDSLLRRDSTLSTVSSAFKTIMASGFSVNGKTMYLSDFGIETLGYFEAADNEKNAYHIWGDEDDEYKSSESNKLMAMISSDPSTVMDFFTQLTKSMYDKSTELMKSVEGYSSAFTVYDDKKMQSDYDAYTSKIKSLEAKLTAYEDKWYSKFSKMETAMAKMQSNASAITSLLGG